MGWTLLGLALLSQILAQALLIESNPERLTAVRHVTDWLYFTSLLSTLALMMLFGLLVRGAGKDI